MMNFSSGPKIWIWQNSVSPHIVFLANELAHLGFSVYYGYFSDLDSERRLLGWPSRFDLDVNFVKFKNVSDVCQALDGCSRDTIHIVQGIRGIKSLDSLRLLLSHMGLQYWVMIERLDTRFYLGSVKNLFYARAIYKYKNNVIGYLAIGAGTKDWLTSLGVNESNVYDFAYFLQPWDLNFDAIKVENKLNGSKFNFIFVGRLIALKNVSQLIKSLSGLLHFDFKLTIVGSGPLEGELRALAETLLVGRVRWMGSVQHSEVVSMITEADCLVLPSSHDGWGAVVSEALICGTPVVCTKHCGSSVVVDASGVGAVVPSNKVEDLKPSLQALLEGGRWNSEKRKKLRQWAQCLTAESGAEYFRAILEQQNTGESCEPPWLINSNDTFDKASN